MRDAQTALVIQVPQVLSDAPECIAAERGQLCDTQASKCF